MQRLVRIQPSSMAAQYSRHSEKSNQSNPGMPGRDVSHFIDLNSGKPSQMVVAARRQKVYVVDQAEHNLGVIDMKKHTS